MQNKGHKQFKMQISALKIARFLLFFDNIHEKQEQEKIEFSPKIPIAYKQNVNVKRYIFDMRK